MNVHYSLTPQERTQIDGRWHGDRAPLCATGDGHWFGINSCDWTGTPPPVTCPRCIERNHLVAYRERSRVVWDADLVVKVSQHVR